MDNSTKVKNLLGAATALGSGPVLNAISKILPGIGSFVSGAYTAGYAADQIIDFVRDKLTTGSEKRRNRQLQNREAEGNLRPDERAEISQEERRLAPFEAGAGLAKLVGQAGAGTATAGAAASAAEQERQQQEAIQNQQQAESQRRQEEGAFKRERTLERDLETKKYRQAADTRAAESAKRAQHAEERAQEKHKAAMAKSQGQPKSQAPKPANIAKEAKGAGKPPESYLDALRELDELINRLP